MSEVTSYSSPAPGRFSSPSVVENGANPLGRIDSRFDKSIMPYWLNENTAEVEEALRNVEATHGGGHSPFVVVGMGRCGCHVAAELAQMVSAASGPARNEDEKHDTSMNFIRKMFRPSQSSGVFTIEPVMVIGDIDETTFDDVNGLLLDSGDLAKYGDRLLRINYKPLVVGGAGHVPLFAEFFTRGLLSVPARPDSNTKPPWLMARMFLIDSCFRRVEKSRLVFYLFSAGGGTGSGSSAELMRAQRYAIAMSSSVDPQIYFTGVAILPADLDQNRAHLINAGRTMIQYLADLNLRLDSAAGYDEAPDFQSGASTNSPYGVKNLMPWDSLAIISNDVMAAPGSQVSQEQAEVFANQYIAQQMFNMAACQLPTTSYVGSGHINITKKNFQTIRLDPQDLKTGLAGPYAICFSASHAHDMMSISGAGLDEMFLRAISLPRAYQISKRDEHFQLIEGISVAPDEKEIYDQTLRNLTERLRNEARSKQNESGILEESDFEELQSIPMYERCPRVVFVFTVPQEGEIPSTTMDRLLNLLQWLMPNLSQTRGAIVRGTTAFYTLSIYLESSVVLCPDIQKSIKNYLKLCWNQRRTKRDEFLRAFDEFIAQPPPIEDREIEEWLGDRENYGVNVPNFRHTVDGLNANWRSFVHESAATESRKKALLEHDVSSVRLSSAEVAAALRYLNYVNNLAQPEIV